MSCTLAQLIKFDLPFVLLSACEQRVREDSKQRGRSGIYPDTSGLSKGALREPAAKHADRRDLRFSRRFGIIRGVTDCDGVGAFDVEFLQNDLEEIRRGF